MTTTEPGSPLQVIDMSRRKVSAVKATRNLLARHDVRTPSYFPLTAMIEMQQHVGYKFNSNAKPRHKPLSFTPTEHPRSVNLNGSVPTPSWFRYANIDGPNQSYAPMPSGYEWDVEYYRREDGTMVTNPALVEIPPNEPRPRKKMRLLDYARSLAVDEEELTDEGIEDISSDEDLYTKNEGPADINRDVDGESTNTETTAYRSQSDRSSVDSWSQSPGASTANVFSTRTASIMAPLMPGRKPSYVVYYDSIDNRVDSRHQSMSEDDYSENEGAIAIHEIHDNIKVDEDEFPDSGVDDQIEEGDDQEEEDENGEQG